MTREELEMRTLVRESDVIDRTDGSELAKAFNYLWEKYVEQEPKTGHWIFQKIKQGKRMWCSNCDSAFDLCCNQIKRYNKAKMREDMWTYCPWCGAKMEVDQ